MCGYMDKELDMKKLVGILIGMGLLALVGVSYAAEPYKGEDPPPLRLIQRYVWNYSTGVNVLGIHKERDGAYIVFTDKSAPLSGGPFHLYRLESNEWVMTVPGHPFLEYRLIPKD